jgi:hypothetical protein
MIFFIIDLRIIIATYSENSIFSEVGIIMRRQFNKIVVMMIIENSGWTSM